MTSKAWIQTISGKKFPVDEPDPAQIDIEDIAHALSMLVRFNGHCIRFYSVAEHSVHVSNEIDPELALIGLLHDAAEAYLGDVPSPLKKELDQFKKFELRMEKAIGKAFGVEPELFGGKELKRADVQLLVDEKSRVDGCRAGAVARRGTGGEGRGAHQGLGAGGSKGAVLGKI